MFSRQVVKSESATIKVHFLAMIMNPILCFCLCFIEDWLQYIWLNWNILNISFFFLTWFISSCRSLNWILRSLLKLKEEVYRRYLLYSLAYYVYAVFICSVLHRGHPFIQYIFWISSSYFCNQLRYCLMLLGGRHTSTSYRWTADPSRRTQGLFCDWHSMLIDVM